MDEFIKDRDEAFASGDIEKVKAYCEKYEIVRLVWNNITEVTNGL